MSILIKGMQMPKNCAFCPVEHYDCPLLGEDEKGWGIDVTAYFDGNERHPDCPLVEVPPHGRLIDADALIRVSEMINGEWKTYIEEFEVDDAPTIIESEEEDV